MGISPSGATIFTSQLYDISDKEIVARSGIVDPRFWEECDSCMADRVFTITDDLKALNVELNIPAFLSGGDHLTKAEENHICLYTCGTCYTKNKNILPETKFHLLSMVQ